MLVSIPHQDEEISKLCYIDDKVTMITEKEGNTDDSLTVRELNLRTYKPGNTYNIPYYSKNHEAIPGGLMYTYGEVKLQVIKQTFDFSQQTGTMGQDDTWFRSG